MVERKKIAKSLRKSVNTIEINGLNLSQFQSVKAARKKMEIHSEALLSAEVVGYYSSEFLLHMAKGYMSVPQSPFHYNHLRYPYWHVFRILHLGEVVSNTSIKQLEANMSIIASIDVEEIANISLEYVLSIGVKCGIQF